MLDRDGIKVIAIDSFFNFYVYACIMYNFYVLFLIHFLLCIYITIHLT
jgi:hypothetical protein